MKKLLGSVVPGLIVATQVNANVFVVSSIPKDFVKAKKIYPK